MSCISPCFIIYINHYNCGAEANIAIVKFSNSKPLENMHLFLRRGSFVVLWQHNSVDVCERLTCTPNWRASCSAGVLNSAVHQSCAYSQPIIRSLSQASHSSLWPCFTHPSTYFHLPPLPQNSPTDACCCVCWWIFSNLLDIWASDQKSKISCVFYLLKTAVNISKPEHLENYVIAPKALQVKGKICALIWEWPSSLIKISITGISCHWHIKTQCSWTVKWYEFFKARKYAEITFLKRGKNFCLEKGGWSLSLLLDWT